MNKPPKFAHWIISRLSEYELRFSLEGDLEEIFQFKVANRGLKQAKRWYWINAIKTALRYWNFVLKANMAMFYNYFKATIRNIKRYKGQSFINIFGLSIGLSFTILIILYVSYEFSFDTFHKNSKNIFRVVMRDPGNIWQGTDWANSTPGILRSVLREEFPEVANATRIRPWRGLVSYQNRRFLESGILIVDPEFLDILTFRFLTRSSDEALKDPFTILLTQETAEKYFADKNPVGEIIRIDNKYDYKIEGILENVPDNSHLKFDFLISFSTLYSIYQGRENSIEKWGANFYKTYIQLEKGVNPDEFESKIIDLEKRHRNVETNNEFHIQPLLEIHLQGNLNYELETNSEMKYIYLYSTLAFFILLMASLNYANLSTARSAYRSKEIGIRKVTGAQKKDIIKQFLGESIVMSLIALMISLVLVMYILPKFSIMIDRELTFSSLFRFDIFIILILTTIVVGVVSGSYPSLILSSFKPANSIKANPNIKRKKSFVIRNFIVTFQFILSIALIFFTLVIFSQLNYMNTKDLGFKKENVLTIPLQDKNLRENYKTLIDELSLNPLIVDITASDQLPTAIRNSSDADWEGKTEDASIFFYRALVDFNFLKFYGMQLSDGRDFSKEMISDVEQALILNKTAVKAIGWEDPIGKKLDQFGEGRVIGVVEDFHFYSLHTTIEPLIIGLVKPGDPRFLSVKINSSYIPESLSFIAEKYKEISPDYPFTYSFLDERIYNIYKTERMLGKAFIYFSLIAILIACLGLIGLVSFVSIQKTKEIGIRKILGASTNSILFIILKDFIICFAVANMIAWPVSIYVMNRWLQNFAYKANVQLDVFLVSGTVVLIIALISIGFQTIRAALANPVDSLRYE